jgi:hypothetical protein
VTENVIDPTWRTSTVVAICEGMRQTGDYSGCPILADALQDANCADESLLGDLRDSEKEDDAISRQRLVALVASEESEGAVRRVEELAVNVGQPYSPYSYSGPDYDAPTGSLLTYTDIMSTAREYASEAAENGYGDTHIHMGTNEAYKDIDFNRFWEDYQLITGEAVKGHLGRFFSCSC